MNTTQNTILEILRTRGIALFTDRVAKRAEVSETVARTALVALVEAGHVVKSEGFRRVSVARAGSRMAKCVMWAAV